MKRLFRIGVSLFIAVSATACLYAQDAGFTITGSVKGLTNGTKLYLTYNTPDNTTIKDSTEVKDTVFVFKGKVPGILKAWIHTKDNTTLIPIYLENADMKMS